MAMFANAEEMLAAIAEDDIEGPDLMSWKTWQAWRAHEGRRPAIRRGDAVSTTIAEESTMWKLVMEGVHGPDWRTELGRFNLDAGLPEISPLLDEGEADRTPAAGNGAEATPARQGGGSRSHYADTASSGRPGAEELRRQLLVDIDPVKEALPEFCSRVDRIATVISMHADPVSQ